MAISISVSSDALHDVADVLIKGFSEPIRVGDLTALRANRLKVELERAMTITHLMTLEVVNYSLAGRGVEVRLPDGQMVLMAIVEKDQDRFRTALRAYLADETRPTAYDRLLEGE